MDIQIQRMYRFDTDRPLKAFVDISINDALLIKGCRVMRRTNGELWVSMPREQSSDSKWYDSVRCLTQEIREQITQVVLAAYREDESFQTTPTGERYRIENNDEPLDEDVIINN